MQALGKLTLTTGGVGGTTGTMGVAGGGGAAGGGTGTDVTFAVMVGTGVAAMTGVWDTVGGMFWKGVAGETEDTAATCCEPSRQDRELNSVGSVISRRSCYPAIVLRPSGMDQDTLG